MCEGLEVHNYYLMPNLINEFFTLLRKERNDRAKSIYLPRA